MSAGQEVPNNCLVFAIKGDALQSSCYSGHCSASFGPRAFFEAGLFIQDNDSVPDRWWQYFFERHDHHYGHLDHGQGAASTGLVADWRNLGNTWFEGGVSWQSSRGRSH